MEFDQWRSRNFNNEFPTPKKGECGLEDEGGVTFGMIGIHGSIYFAEEWGRKDCPRYNHKKSQGFVKNEDQGGSYHMTYKRDYLFDFEEYDGGNILFGDGRECRVRGTSRVQVQMRDGSSFVLDNVKYISELRRNLISMGTLEKEGFTVKMQLGKMKAIKGSLVGRKQLGEYQIGWKISGQCFLTKGVEFEVEPQEDHAFKVEPQGNVGHIAGSQEVQTQDLLDYHSACNREQQSARELFKYREDINDIAFAVAAVEKTYAHESFTFNDKVACEESSDDNNDYYWEYTPGMFVHLFLYIDVMAFSRGCKVEIRATKGLLDEAKGNILGDCDVEKNGRSITGYGLMIQGCAVRCEAILQHMEALLTTEAVYMTLMEAEKEVVRLMGSLESSR
ncbi:hypothetical protein Tco_0019203 [Tanacetum coccineum]